MYMHTMQLTIVMLSKHLFAHLPAACDSVLTICHSASWVLCVYVRFNLSRECVTAGLVWPCGTLQSLQEATSMHVVQQQGFMTILYIVGQTVYWPQQH